MKNTLLILSFLFPAALSAQTFTYSIEVVKPDSIYLVETIEKPIEGSPRGQITTTYKLFRDTTGISDFRKQLLDRAAEYQKQADEYAQNAAFLRAQSKAIANVQAQKFNPSETVTVERNDLPTPMKPAPPAKPAKKPKPPKKPKAKKTN